MAKEAMNVRQMQVLMTELRDRVAFYELRNSELKNELAKVTNQLEVSFQYSCSSAYLSAGSEARSRCTRTSNPASVASD